jgi:hypothetical protein
LDLAASNQIEAEKIALTDERRSEQGRDGILVGPVRSEQVA